MALPTQAQLYEEVDRQFFEAHPDAPRRLDPNDSGQADLVQDWLARRDQILNDWVDSIFAGFFPYAGKLDPNNPGDGTLIEYWLDIRNAIRDGTPSHYNWDQPPTATATDTSASTPAAASSSPTPAVDGSAPAVPAHLDENELKEYIHAIIEGEHYVGESAEVLAYLSLAGGAEEEALFVEVMEGMGVVGIVASTIIVLWAVVEAFGTGERLEEQEGFCYGLMWQTYNMPNETKQFIDWAPNTADELREAFYEGVAQGREKAADSVVHSKLMLAIAYYQAKGSDLSWSQYHVLNDLWKQNRETDVASKVLQWPKPQDMEPLIP